MDNISSPGPRHELFAEWAKAKGVTIHGVKPARIHGRGIGIIAERAIKAGDQLVNAPPGTLVTTDLIPQGVKDSHTGITVNGLFASYLAFETGIYGEWRATWPSMRDFELSIPLLWPPANIDPVHHFYRLESVSCLPLPPEIGGLWLSSHVTSQYRKQALQFCLRSKQEVKLQKDWAIVSRVFPNATFKEYTYFWLIVNTRCFYYDLPTLLKPLTRDDHMCLCPFVDYFNHKDEGCAVTFDKKTGYTVTSDRDYMAGEEISTSYGSHSNDFLLAEYGFILESNTWDSLSLDALLLSLLSEEDKERLDEAGYAGKYTLSSEGVCYRTQVAVRTQTLSEIDWLHFVNGREDLIRVEDDKESVNDFVRERLLRPYREEATLAERYISEGMAKGTIEIAGPILSLVRHRWCQIIELIDSVLLVMDSD